MFAKWIEQDGRFSFSEEDHGGVEISDEAHAKLFADHGLGKLITQGPDGLPVATDPPALTTAQLAAAARARRTGLLAATDWTHLSDASAATTTKWAPYRQALKDVPEQSGFPGSITWPTAP